MELLALGKPIKKPPRSDERDGELFCGTPSTATALSISHSDTTFSIEKDCLYMICLLHTGLTTTFTNLTILCETSSWQHISNNQYIKTYLGKATTTGTCTITVNGSAYYLSNVFKIE